MIGFIGPLLQGEVLAPWAGLLLDLTLKATLLLALTGLGMGLLRQRSAAARHWVLGMAFVALLLLPVLSTLVPAWQVPMPALFEPEALSPLSPRERVEQTLLPLIGTPAPDVPLSQSIGPVPPGAAPPASAQVPAWPSLLVLVWLGGAVLLTTRLVSDQVVLRWYAATAREIATPDWQRLIRGCAARVGLDRPVRVMISSHVVTPMTFGLLRPVILLPHAFAGWSLERWEVVLMHELAHVRRRDYIVNVVSVLVCALYWYNPLVWPAARRLRTERERACDDCVLRQGFGEISYAEHLLAIARQLARRPGPSIVAMTRRTGLRTRLEAILDPRTRRDAFGLRQAVVSAVAATVLIVPLAALQFHAPSAEAQTASVSSDILLRELSSSDALRQEEAALQLGEARVGDASVALIGTLRDADPGVRGLSAWALGNIGAFEAVPALSALVWDHDDFVREMAIRALARIGHEDAVCPLMRARRTPNAHTRAAVVWALGRIANPSAIRAVVRSLEDVDPFVRQVAEDALVFADNEHTDCILKDLMKDENPELRTHLTRVLDRRRAAGSPQGGEFLS